MAANSSAANWRIVSNSPYRAGPARRSMVTNDFRTSESSRSSTAYSSCPLPHTATAAAASKPPANTEQRHSNVRSVVSSKSNDHPTAWRKV